MTHDYLLKVEEVSERTRIPVQTLRYWRKEGRGPRSSKIGRRIAYRESDVEAWIIEHFGPRDEAGAANLTPVQPRAAPSSSNTAIRLLGVMQG